MSYSDTLEALSKAATARPWEIEGRLERWIAAPHPRLGSVPVVTPQPMQHEEDLILIASVANHAEDFVRLLRAAEETREQLLRDFAIKCRCDFVTKLSAGIERCVGCRARDRIAAIDSALAPFEEK